MKPPCWEVRAIDGPALKDWNDGIFLCRRYSFTAAEQAVTEFAPRWPEKKLIIIEVVQKENE